MIQRIIIVVLLSVLISFNGKAQDEGLDYFVSTSLHLNNMPNTIRVASITDFGISKNNNLYKIGAIAQIYTDNAESLSESFKLSGAHFGYGRIVQTRKSWINLELKSDVNMQYFKSSWQSNIFNEEFQHYQEYKFHSGETLFDFSVGYGLKLNLSGNFYISQSFTGGIYYSLINTHSDSPEAPEVANGKFDFRSYGNTGLQWNVMFGVGYFFTKK